MVSGVVAATLPIVARILLIDHSPGQGLNASPNAFWGGLVAILLGILLIRNVAGYPGVERASAIIPGFSVSFGILVVMLMMLRLDYSRRSEERRVGKEFVSTCRSRGSPVH